ncbi:MAG TPA: hypothetical protein VM432_02685 [Bdellovibrionales bacterium]|nr:hypothetical protein [Bdellovibrionales bacterium]
MRVLVLGLTALVTISACTSNSVKDELGNRGVAGTYDVPSADALFLRGKYLYKSTAQLTEKHYGEELDLSQRRPVVNLSGTLFYAKYGDGRSTLIANLFHDGKFWIARVPNEGVKNVYFILSYFPPKILGQYVAAHSLLRFEMDDARPVELVAEMPDEAELAKLQSLSPSEAFKRLPNALEDSAHRLKNIAISAEAQWTKNDRYKSYDLKRGLLNAYIQVVRVVSMEERFRNFFDNGRPVNQIKLETDKPLSPILTEGLALSQRDGLTKVYNTLQYNCTTLAFDIVELGLKAKDPRVGEIRKYMQKRVPILSPAKLKGYGGETEVVPMQMDSSLAAEALAALKDQVIVPKRPLCPADFNAEQCSSIKQAVNVVKGVFPSEALPEN